MHLPQKGRQRETCTLSATENAAGHVCLASIIANGYFALSYTYFAYQISSYSADHSTHYVQET